MNKLFDENGMLNLKQLSENGNRDRTKHMRHGSSITKVKGFLSEYKVGDKIRVSDIRKKTGITSLSSVLSVLKRDGFIAYENPGSGRASYVTILQTP